MKEDKPKNGVTCRCGIHTPFDAWALAHLHEALQFTCPNCSAQYVVRNGKARLKPVRSINRKEKRDEIC